MQLIGNKPNRTIGTKRYKKKFPIKFSLLINNHGTKNRTLFHKIAFYHFYIRIVFVKILQIFLWRQKLSEVF